MSQDNILKNRDILAYNLKSLRQKIGIRREELSLALGFDNSYISKLEKSKINITIDKLSLLANYFQVDLVELFKKN